MNYIERELREEIKELEKKNKEERSYEEERKLYHLEYALKNYLFNL